MSGETEVKAKPASRRRGRPSLAETTQLTREAIIARGLELARTKALQDITITGIAQDFGVTAALIHYLIPGKDGLVSGVMNAFYAELCRAWPEPEGNWRQHLEAVAHHSNKFHGTYRGVVLYTATHNRYRIVQIVGEGEIDWGLIYLDRLIQAAQTMGLPPHETMIFCESFVDFITGAARQAIASRLPRLHEDFLRQAIGKLDLADYPGIRFVGDELYLTEPQVLFENSLKMLLDAFEINRARLI